MNCLAVQAQEEDFQQAATAENQNWKNPGLAALPRSQLWARVSKLLKDQQQMEQME